ncbi:MAG TPA: hypothetical protein VMZ25_00280 [Terriglobales bacterium]|nr:hypothetical protein [Terriglobales bacterium]
MPDPVHSRARSEERIVGLLAAVISIGAFLYFFHTQQILLYGDAVAHLNIARRVVDSLTPGPLQLGTVWLPFPHLLMLPFVWVDRLWQSGIAGSLPSMAAYVAGVLGMLRLGRAVTSPAGARVATLAYAANPNLIYMQSTAMTESIFLALVIWAVYFVAEYSHAIGAQEETSAIRSLYRAAAIFLCAILTRYDGWFLAAVAVIVVLVLAVGAPVPLRRRLGRPVRNFVLIVALGPIAWLIYNYAIFGNGFEFATGPYSARGIAERTTRLGDPPHPGFHSPKTAAIYLLKTARLEVAEGKRERMLFIIALVGTALAVSSTARIAWLLWVPLPFYMLSIAYGGVPVFIPQWWPFSYYNVRYGLQLLPALCLFMGVAVEVIQRLVQNLAAQRAILLVVVGAVAASYTSVWRQTPICLREARVNAVSRVGFESALAAELRKLPPGSRLLMFTGNYVGALQAAGIDLKQVVQEGNYRIWDAALTAPNQAADYVFAVDGDPVAAAVKHRPQGLTPIAEIQTPEKPRAILYRTHR